MAPTSDERHEVAERLRRDAAIGDGLRAKGLGMTIDLTEASSYLQDITMLTGASGGGTVEWTVLERRLADLIDPTCEVDYRRYLYGRCAYEYHLSCGHSVDRPWRTPPAYCPECGAKCIAGEGDGDED